jgi:glucose/arabinose dehydrogenase/mono/diheme cytochrome c family protein
MNGRKSFTREIFKRLARGTSFAACLTVASAATLTPAPMKMPLDPPVFGYSATNEAFPGLDFGRPLCLATPPGETNRLFVLDQGGHIYVITNLANPDRSTFMNLSSSRLYSGSESGVLGIAFHPGYATNRYFFVFYSPTTNGLVGGLFQRVSRFQTSLTNANVALTNTELILINQKDPAGNHNGSDLHFGPDGYLYISFGDGGVQYDGDHNSQLITSNFFSAICRIDVDSPPRPTSVMPNPHRSNTNNPLGTINYRVPADNPFFGRTNYDGRAINSNQIRTEFYATGFRNPFRFSFDPLTGVLYCGDVGQDTWEEVDIITKGGNYGWAYLEGTHNGYRASNTVTEPLIPPIAEYHHGSAANQGNAVIGGVVYRGTRMSQLVGSYVFGDNTPIGNVWMLRYDGTNATPMQNIATRAGLSSFGYDPRNGDILMTDVNGGGIYRLMYNTNSSTGTPLPPTLADTGAFTNLSALTSGADALTPSDGMVPYDVNTPLWSDNAKKSRWFLSSTNARIGFSAEGPWSFPPGMTWVKHFDLELTNGVASSTHRLETRVLVKNSGGVYGVTYRWGNSLTNATLVPEEGMDESFTINDGGTLRTQVWHYPSRAECVACHTRAGGWALGFNTVQLNREFGTNGNQLAAMSASGCFTAPITNLNSLRALAAVTNSTMSLEWRVRSYLAANCAQCHQSGGSALGFWNASITNSTAHAGLINGPLNNDGGNTNARVIAPGSLTNSMLLARISKRGPGQMPPLASNLVDTNAVDLLVAWITSDATNFTTNPQWQVAASLQLNGTNAQIDFVQPANAAAAVEQAGDLFGTNVWRFLDVPENRPSYPAAPASITINDPLSNAPQKYFRLKLTAP